MFGSPVLEPPVLDSTVLDSTVLGPPAVASPAPGSTVLDSAGLDSAGPAGSPARYRDEPSWPGDRPSWPVGNGAGRAQSLAFWARRARAASHRAAAERAAGDGSLGHRHAAAGGFRPAACPARHAPGAGRGSGNRAEPRSQRQASRAGRIAVALGPSHGVVALGPPHWVHRTGSVAPVRRLRQTANRSCASRSPD